MTRSSVGSSHGTRAATMVDGGDGGVRPTPHKGLDLFAALGVGYGFVGSDMSDMFEAPERSG